MGMGGPPPKKKQPKLEDVEEDRNDHLIVI
jgi:hypothetical protein